MKYAHFIHKAGNSKLRPQLHITLHHETGKKVMSNNIKY